MFSTLFFAVVRKFICILKERPQGFKSQTSLLQNFLSSWLFPAATSNSLIASEKVSYRPHMEFVHAELVGCQSCNIPHVSTFPGFSLLVVWNIMRSWSESRKWGYSAFYTVWLYTCTVYFVQESLELCTEQSCWENKEETNQNLSQWRQCEVCLS